MKKLPILLLVMCCAIIARGQNLVSNASFESNSGCPTNFSQIINSNGWNIFNGGSSDYFHICGGSNVLVPTNYFGSQAPAHGNAYAGVYCFQNPTSTSQFAEYITQPLLQPMIPGITYQVSLSVSLADNAGFANDGLGVFFFDKGPTYYSNNSVLAFLTPQVTFTSYGPITNKTTWTRLSGTITADSAYDNIAIGCFTPLAAMYLVPNSMATDSYYYIDSVVVKFANVLSINYADSLLCAGDTIHVPFWVTNGAFNAGNIFTLQLSDANGGFSNPTILASLSGTASSSISGIIPSSLTPGSGYRVRITATNQATISNISLKPITLGTNKPAKPVIVSNAPLCAEKQLNLNATSSTSGVTYKWKGPNGFSATTATTGVSNINAAGAGDYMVTTWLYGCATRDTETVVVKPLPAAPNATANTPVCEEKTLLLASVSPTPGTTCSWTGPAGFNSTLQNPSVSNVQLSATGAYIVTADLNGCIAKDTVDVYVQVKPKNLNATSNSPVCQDKPLFMNVTNSTPGVTYSWTGPGNFVSVQQNPTIGGASLTNTGDYIVTLSANGCTESDTITVIVKPAPIIPAATSNSPVCFGNDITLFSTTGQVNCNYTWAGPNNFTSTQQNPVISNVNPAMAGMYHVMTELDGCTSPIISTNVVVLYYPSSVGLQATPDDTLCMGEQGQFVALPANAGSNPQFTWLLNGHIINGATGISYASSNLVTGDKLAVVLTPDNTCSKPDTSKEITMTILPWVTPSVSISASPGTLISPWQTITFTATAINGGKNPMYQWKRNGKDIVGAVSDTWSAYLLENNDTISVELHSSEQCPKPEFVSSNKLIVAIKTGIEDTESMNSLRLYPNPNNGRFTITGNLTGLEKHEVYDMLGRLMGSGQHWAGNINKLELNFAGTPAGAYVLKLYTASSVQSLRFNIN
jgi:hypothetical protein